jgi:hypothetical protein
MHPTLPRLEPVDLPALQRGMRETVDQQRGRGLHARSIDALRRFNLVYKLLGLPIEVRNHFCACTAGQGSSCGRSLSAVHAAARLDAVAVAVAAR